MGLIKDRRALRRRAMQDPGPAPQYNQQGLQGFQNTAMQGSQALSGARGAQQDALGMYRNMAMGNGPSVAQAQLAQQNASNVASQQAMIAQGRGGNMSGMQRAAGAAGAAGAMGGQQQLAALRAGEQQAAMQGYGAMGSTMAQQGLQQQMAAQGLMGQAYGQQLAGDTQWGLGQRAMDIDALDRNRKFGMNMASGIFDMVQKGATMGLVGGSVGGFGKGMPG